MRSEDLVSRFVRTDDEWTDDFVYPIEPIHLTRRYEYHWAAKFAEGGRVVLDAACGAWHPLKFYLAEHCEETHACDLDERILSLEALRKEAEDISGPIGAERFPEASARRIDFRVCSLTRLPYESNTFDRVFCISVLEHMPDASARHPFLLRFPVLWRIPLLLGYPRMDIVRALMEFRRVLAPGGLIVLTFDYPRVNLSHMDLIVRRLGLRYAGGGDFTKPENALLFEEKDLNIFRMVLTKPR